MRKLSFLLVLSSLLVLPAIALTGCGGASSSQPTGVQESEEMELTEEEVADERATLNQE